MDGAKPALSQTSDKGFLSSEVRCELGQQQTAAYMSFEVGSNSHCIEHSYPTVQSLCRKEMLI